MSTQRTTHTSPSNGTDRTLSETSGAPSQGFSDGQSTTEASLAPLGVPLDIDGVRYGTDAYWELLKKQVPPRYVRGCGGDAADAQRRWQATVQWRRDNKINGLLNEPQPHYDTMKKGFPIYAYGRSRGGHPVFYEQIGKADIPGLEAAGEATGLGLDDLLRHYVFFVECVWNVIEPSDEAQMITVEDVSGVGVKSLTPKALKFISMATKIMRDNYVERCYKSYVVNAPRMFVLVWKVISPLFDPRTRDKIKILGSDFTELHQEIDPSMLPREYGGTCERPLHDSDEERKIASLVQAVLEQNGMKMGESLEGDGAKQPSMG